MRQIVTSVYLEALRSFSHLLRHALGRNNLVTWPHHEITGDHISSHLDPSTMFAKPSTCVQKRAHASKSEHTRPNATASRFKSAPVSKTALRVGILRATHAHAHASIPALTRKRTRGRRGDDEVGGLLLRRPMIEQGAVSTRVRARCDLLGSSRAHTSRRKSPHANSCRPS